MLYFKKLNLILFYFFFIANSSFVFSAFEKKDYISIKTFLNKYSKIKFSWQPLNLTFNLSKKNLKGKFQIDSNFYIFNRDHFKLSKPPIYYNDQIYLPLELSEQLREKFRLKKEKNHTPPTVRDVDKTPKKISSKTLGKQKNLPKNKKIDFIVLDAGHGGKDPGAHGHNDIMEKKITLKLSKYIVKILRKKFPDTKVILTRSTDKFLGLERRSKMANSYQSKNKLGIFISLHCNASFSPRVRGFEIYYLAQNPSNEEARRVMIRENQTYKGKKYVKEFESYLIKNTIQRESKSLAMQLHRSFNDYFKGMIRSRGIRKADFVVLRGVLMPALLIELGYLTNAYEAKILRSSRFQIKVAHAIAKGIKNFILNKNKSYIIAHAD